MMLKNYFSNCIILLIVLSNSYGKNVPTHHHNRVRRTYLGKAVTAPYLVGIVKSDVFCTGSLVHERYVLTTAQCFKNEFIKDVKVYIGVDQITDDEPYYLVDDMVRHPNYLPAEEDSAALYDIALLKLDEPVILSNKRIELIKLDSNPWPLDTTRKCSILGYGVQKEVASEETSEPTVEENPIVEIPPEFAENTEKEENNVEEAATEPNRHMGRDRFRSAHVRDMQNVSLESDFGVAHGSEVEVTYGPNACGCADLTDEEKKMFVCLDEKAKDRFCYGDFGGPMVCDGLIVAIAHGQVACPNFTEPAGDILLCGNENVVDVYTYTYPLISWIKTNLPSSSPEQPRSFSGAHTLYTPPDRAGRMLLVFTLLFFSKFYL